MLGIAAALGAAFPAGEAWACSLSPLYAVEVRYSGVEPGSPEEARRDRKAKRAYYRSLRRDAEAGRIGDPSEFAGNVVNALIPPIMAGPDRGVGCGGIKGDADPAGYRSVDSFGAEFEAKVGAPIDWNYGSYSTGFFQDYVEVPRRCNAEFRAGLVSRLAERADPADLRTVWGEVWARGYNYGAGRLLRFSAGRSGPLQPMGPKLPYKLSGRELAVEPVLSEQHRAMMTFLDSNPAAGRIIVALDVIIADVQSRPGGDERYCPAAIARADQIVERARRHIASERR